MRFSKDEPARSRSLAGASKSLFHSSRYVAKVKWLANDDSVGKPILNAIGGGCGHKNSGYGVLCADKPHGAYARSALQRDIRTNQIRSPLFRCLYRVRLGWRDMKGCEAHVAQRELDQLGRIGFILNYQSVHEQP